MTEKDLYLKAASRRLFWRMGFSTKVDVPLRAFVPNQRRAGQSRPKPPYEAFTDLDVLGIQIAPDLRVQSVIADCKTSVKGSTERMFWIRGVADFFAADDAYMVRAGDVTAASRQLAARLGVGVLTPDDLAALEGHYGAGLPAPDAVAGFLFDGPSIAAYRHAFTELDRRLHPLREYQEFDFWVYEEHRNLQQLVAHLSTVAKHLDPGHPVHQALFFESAWLYALSLARAVHHVRRTHVTDIDTSLREYVFGGQLGLREKQHLAKVLRAAAGKEGGDPDEGVFPPYFAALLELSSRFLRRPAHASTVLRYAEWASEAHVVRQASPAAEVFGESFDDLAAKLLADVCGFLVSTAGLDSEFRARARAVLAPATLGAPETVASDTESGADKTPASSGRSPRAQESLPLDIDATSSQQDSSD
ncbi:MAG: hypothetical protein ACRD29_01425 [Acidimicrobiales bacterium]